jgi:hypothetical protein
MITPFSLMITITPMPYYAIIIFAIIDYAITLHFIIFDIIAITPLPPLADLRHADAIRCHY